MLSIYEALRTPPQEALKPISAGRLKGFTDINPMWRIKRMTETFGPCGIGWGTCDVRFWTDSGANETAVFCSLVVWYINKDGNRSGDLFGIGGSKLIANETKGPRLDDEAYKKAYTDAIGVALKSIGMGADVYFAKDTSSKYNTAVQQQPIICAHCKKPVADVTHQGKIITAEQIVSRTSKHYGNVLCWECAEEEAARMKAAQQVKAE